MIHLKIAEEFVKNEKDIYSLALDRFKGRDLRPVGDARLDEPLEDVLIKLFTESSDPKIKTDILRACKKVYEEIYDFINNYDSKKNEEIEDMIETFGRFVGMSSPEELEQPIKDILFKALEKNIPSDLSMYFMEAYMGFEPKLSDRKTWNYLLKHKDFCAYAFNALLEIDPFSNEMDLHLDYLKRQKKDYGWTVDTDFLEEELKRERIRKLTLFKK